METVFEDRSVDQELAANDGTA